MWAKADGLELPATVVPASAMLNLIRKYSMMRTQTPAVLSRRSPPSSSLHPSPRGRFYGSRCCKVYGVQQVLRPILPRGRFYGSRCCKGLCRTCHRNRCFYMPTGSSDALRWQKGIDLFSAYRMASPGTGEAVLALCVVREVHSTAAQLLTASTVYSTGSGIRSRCHWIQATNQE
jgi:hypothetical protein